MKKHIATLFMVTTLAASLTSCGTGYDYKDGIMVKVGDKTYTTDELFANYYGLDTSSGVQAYYNAINNLLIEANVKKDASMDQSVQGSIDDFKKAAETSAKSNGTTTSEELEKKLESENVDSLEELEAKYYLAEKKTRANNEFYSTKNYNEKYIPEYIENYHPYHVRHILVKVDASTKYEGKISSSNAKNIANVVKRLASGNESFGNIARDKSEDTSSATWFGELQQPMTTKTSYVSEFKLNLYTYDAYFNTKTNTNETVKSDLLASSSAKTFDGKSVSEEYASLFDDGVYGIPYSSVFGLDYYSEKTKDNKGLDVTSNNAENYYPRNIIFNNYFNNHSLSYIYLDDADTANSAYYTSADYNAANESGRFQIVEGLSDKLNQFTTAEDTFTTVKSKISGSKKILCDDKGYPILVARAGTGSSSDSSSGYQGIHFISVINDPFEHTQEELVNYYNIDTPDTSSSSWTVGSTFISYNYSSSRSDYTTKINNFKDGSSDSSTASSSVKSTLDSNFDFRMYESNLAAAEAGTGANGVKISFTSEGASKIKSAIANYISTTRYDTAKSEKDSWDSSWKSFLEYLQEYNVMYANKVLPLSAIEAFESGTSAVDTFEAGRAAAL